MFLMRLSLDCGQLKDEKNKTEKEKQAQTPFTALCNAFECTLFRTEVLKKVMDSIHPNV